MSAAREVDWAAEGLLDGLHGEARAARVQLLEDLLEAGCELAEIRRASEQGRLANLLVDHALSGGERYTADALAARTGLSSELLARLRRSAGFAMPPPDEPALTDRDLELAQLTARFVAAGLDEEALFDVTRVLGRGMEQGAEAIRSLIESSFSDESLSERELARRDVQVAEQLLPLTGPLLQLLLTLHLRDHLRQQAARRAVAPDGDAGTRPVAVCFADLVGYTRLGQRLEADEVGSIAHRLEILATEIIEPPVRLVKSIGDAVMLVAPEPIAVIDAGLELIDRAREEGDEFPDVHVGVACGQALNRSGDFYGHPVNLASRITAVAWPASVLVSDRAHDAAGERFAWSYAGERTLRGVRAPEKLFRARRLTEPGSRDGEPPPP